MRERSRGNSHFFNDPRLAELFGGLFAAPGKLIIDVEVRLYWFDINDRDHAGLAIVHSGFAMPQGN
ncbi:MAG: hypothetical protein ACXW4Z_16910 [Candidatus Binatia bacterium]